VRGKSKGVGSLSTALVGLVFVRPYALSSPTLGDDITRNTIRLALVCYAAAANLMLLLRRDEWNPLSARAAWARWCWTLAWLTYLIHLGAAFHYYHDWSHTDAVRHTEEVSGFGPGIYFSHLFTLLWTVDVAFWWFRPECYAARSPWIDRLLHGYMFFLVFNAMVVYEEGPIRYAGILLTVELAALCAYRRTRSRCPKATIVNPD
jgi:hypothetical protein